MRISFLAATIITISAIVLAGIGGCQRAPNAAATENDRIQVSVEIDYQGSRNKNDLIELELISDKTVLGALIRASESEDLDVGLKGSGEIAFVKSINGVENQKSAGNNWIYYVNGKLGDCGAGARQLVDQDKVQWKFTEYDLK